MQLSFYTTLGVSQLLLQICNLHLGSSPCIHGGDPMHPWSPPQLGHPWALSSSGMWANMIKASVTTAHLSYRFPILKLPPPPCAVLLVNWDDTPSRKIIRGSQLPTCPWRGLSSCLFLFGTFGCHNIIISQKVKFKKYQGNALYQTWRCHALYTCCFFTHLYESYTSGPWNFGFHRFIARSRRWRTRRGRTRCVGWLISLRGWHMAYLFRTEDCPPGD